MANRLQWSIYNFGNVVPLAMMTALVWHLEFKTWRVPIILIIVAISATVLFASCFYYGKNNCAKKTINVSKMISKDIWVVAYIFAYILPLAYTIIADYNIVTFILAGLMLVLAILPSVIALPNILLFAVGYHFYELETENTGVGDYILISKRQHFRNKSDVKTVIRFFEKLLIDTEEGQ